MALGSLEESPGRGTLLWLLAAALGLAGLASVVLSLERGQRALAVIAFLSYAISLCLILWRQWREIFALLNASARNQNLRIARSVDRSLGEILDRARQQTARTSAALERVEHEILTAFRARPVMPRLAGRLLRNSLLGFLATLSLLSLLAMSLAAANCSGGVCEAIYDHSCVAGTGPGARPVAVGIHFLYYQTAGLFNLAGELHRPVTRAAQLLTVLTSLTWMAFLAGGLGGRFGVLLMVHQGLRPEELAREAIAGLRAELSTDATHFRSGVAPSGGL